MKTIDSGPTRLPRQQPQRPEYFNPFVQWHADGTEIDGEGTVGAVRGALKLLAENLQDKYWGEICILEGCENALDCLAKEFEIEPRNRPSVALQGTTERGAI